MTFFAKWTSPTDINCGFCPRETMMAQADAGGEVRALDVYYSPDALYVDSGVLKRQSDNAVVEVEYLSDEILADMAAAAIANAPDTDTATKCAQHLKSAQTITEAEAIIASYGIDISER